MPLLFRIRIVLEIKQESRLHAHHAAVIHALIAAAWGAGNDCDPVMPDGIWLDAPEQCRISILPGQHYAFGFTTIESTANDAQSRIHRLVDGLKKVGRRKAAAKTVLGGNFQVKHVEDLVSGQPLRTAQTPAPIPQTHFDSETDSVASQSELTLRFHSPLLAERPRKLRLDGHQFFDREWFGSQTFINRMYARLEKLGFAEDSETKLDASSTSVTRNELVWLDFSYGHHDRRKAKHGAVGRVRLSGLNPQIVKCLVEGQYVRVGGATRFGFGQYRIEDLGSQAFICRRSEPLLEIALAEAALDRLSDEQEIPSGLIRQAVHEIHEGTYQPDPHHQVRIGKHSEKQRLLSIPSRRDRILQRCILDFLAPAVDKFLEESSLAYRQGFGLQRAATRLRTAVQKGYQWALKADFRAFFDNIDHRELLQRLNAYIGDDELVELIMHWIRSGSPSEGSGVPTGATLSPLVANLFLDRFDEAIRDAGGYLVRYADDFLILYRTRESAIQAHEVAKEMASSICLELNREKTRILDLREPFEFLGFRFQFSEQWEMSPLLEPIQVRDLGWEKKSHSSANTEFTALPGESKVSETGNSTVICGPGVASLNAQGERLLVQHNDGTPTTSLPLHSIRELVLIDTPDITRSALRAMTRHNISWYLIDSFGNPRGSFVVNDPLDTYESIMAQACGMVEPKICLSIARKLVAAKLQNHAALARAIPGKFHDFRTADKLKSMARDVDSVAAIPELLGIEGAGAARWYGNLSGRLSGGFSFERRVAPAASDPINVLLNIGHTVLHNMLTQMIQLVGLAPAIGFMHVPRAGHAALASDLQEPFRHLVERTVIETVGSLRVHDFVRDPDGPYALRIKPRAMKLFLRNLHLVLDMNCQGKGQSMPKPYRMQILSQIRSLRLYLIDPEKNEFRPFVHP